MILTPKQNHIVYRCPDCGTMVYGFLGNYALKADMLRLKCPCGESELTASISTDREKVRMEVPCLYCGGSHHFTVARSLALGEQLFLLNCPYSNMDICFIGPKNEVDDAVHSSEKELSRLLANMGLEHLSELQPEEMNPEEILPDAQIYDIVRFVVKELEAEGKITCPCQSKEYEIAVTADGIIVYCPACGASYLFRTDSVAAAEEFLHCDHLELRAAPGDQTP